MNMRPVDIIVAATPSGGIGRNGKLPWQLPADMAYFRKVTTTTRQPGTQNAVIMGRRTWASIPPVFRPLKGRLNVILSRDADVRSKEVIPDDVLIAHSLEDAVAQLSREPFASAVETVFVIGGAAAFAEALSGSGVVQVDTVYLTRIHSPPIECDVSIPALNDALLALVEFQPRQTEGEFEFQFMTYRNRARHGLQRSIRPSSTSTRHEEFQYLDAIRCALSYVHTPIANTVSRACAQPLFS